MSTHKIALKNASSVCVSIGNTYRRLEPHDAKLDRSGQFPKIHDWTLFVDVVDGSPDIIEKVSFDVSFGTYKCHSPVPVFTSKNGRVLRFSSRQQTFGPIAAAIVLTGAGGTMRRIEHAIVCDQDASRSTMYYHFEESRALRPLRMLKMPESVQFGLEVELTSSATMEAVASMLPVKVKVITDYRDSREQTKGWKIVPDSSIVCSRSVPDCTTFELVSPILVGGNGLSQVHKVLRTLEKSDIKLNKSMGVHVHVDVSSFSISQLVKICQNFIKYEDVIDSFLPPSRRTGSPESNQYCQSNRASIGNDLTNRERHDILARCTNIHSLSDAMNVGNSRYFKLNLQNLRTGRQPTLEFRQHSATTKYDKISAWIRFCTLFCYNSARLASPNPFANRRSLSKQRDALFSYVIKDRAVAQFYKARQASLKHVRDGEESSPCCRGCEEGGTCNTTRRKTTHH